MTRNCDLGVNIEPIGAMQDIEQVSNGYCFPEEARQLISLPPAERNSAFFHCWTRKEAYVKAVGDGLSMPLDSFRVTLMPGDPLEFIHIGKDPETAKEWTLHDVAYIPGYAAAPAYRTAAHLDDSCKESDSLDPTRLHVNTLIYPCPLGEIASLLAAELKRPTNSREEL